MNQPEKFLKIVDWVQNSIVTNLNFEVDNNVESIDEVEDDFDGIVVEDGDMDGNIFDLFNFWLVWLTVFNFYW